MESRGLQVRGGGQGSTWVREVRAGQLWSMWSRGGGGGYSLFEVRYPNKTTDPLFCATTDLSNCPCWITAPCFQGIKGQPIVITVATAACPQWTSFSVVLIQLLLQL